MAKEISYKFLSCEIEHEIVVEVPQLDENEEFIYEVTQEPVMITETRIEVEQVILDKVITCPTQAVFDANYPIAEKEAIPGTIEISGEFDPEPTPAPTAVTWEDLDLAYTEGVDSL